MSCHASMLCPRDAPADAGPDNLAVDAASLNGYAGMFFHGQHPPMHRLSRRQTDQLQAPSSMPTLVGSLLVCHQHPPMPRLPQYLPYVAGQLAAKQRGDKSSKFIHLHPPRRR